jgi:hypothetical protein
VIKSQKFDFFKPRRNVDKSDKVRYSIPVMKH